MKNNYKKTKRILVLFMLVSITSISAQTSAIQRHFEKYGDDDRFTKITISSKMFSLFSNFDTDDESSQEMIETIAKLKGLKMLVGNELDDAESMYKDISKQPEKDMDELMRIEKQGSEFIFFITEKSDGVISEVLMIAFEENQVMMMSIVGEIDLKKMSQLSKHMNIEGFEHLENVGDDD